MFAWSWIRKASLCCVQYVCGGLESMRGWIGPITKQSSTCFGASSKPRHSVGPALKSKSYNREAHRVSTLLERSWWSPSSNEMDNNSSISRQQRSSSSIASSNNTPESSATANSNTNNSAFVNHALVLWKERRQEWVGARQRPKAVEPREPVIRWGAWDVSWSTTYEDLLATSRPFSQRIPLTEMVDFLVDVWEQEGLYE